MAAPICQINLRLKGQTTCRKHKGRQLEIYCKECDTLICLTCHFSTHKGHDACELIDIIPQIQTDIQNFIDRVEHTDLVQVKKDIKSTDTLLKDNTSHFEDLSKKLKMQTEQLKKDLDKLTEQTIAVYKQMEEENIKLIQKYKTDLDIYNRQLKQQVKECKEAIQQGSHIEVYDAGCEIKIEMTLPVKPVLGTASYIPNTNPQPHLELALGEHITLDKGQASTDQDGPVKASDGQDSFSTSQQSEPKGGKTVTTYKLLPETKVVEEWGSSVGITSICPTTDGQVWTCNQYDNALTLLDRKGKIIQQVKHKAGIKDIGLSPTTHKLWICDTENNILELVSGQLIHRFSSKKDLKSICVTASNHVIVGMANNIIKFTTRGQIVLTSSITGTGMPLVCTPRGISECPVTHNVAIIDENCKAHGGDKKRHVIVLDTDFKELFVYNGHIPSTYQQSLHEKNGEVDPYGAVYDSMGNIIIGDRYNNRVLLISGRGEFLRIIHTDTNWTCAVGIDREDVLWARFGGYGIRNVKLLQYSSV